MDLKYIGPFRLKKVYWSLLSLYSDDKLVLFLGEKCSKLILACMIKLKTIERNTNYLRDLICANTNK